MPDGVRVFFRKCMLYADSLTILVLGDRADHGTSNFSALAECLTQHQEVLAV